jgi:hypothetical protein
MKILKHISLSALFIYTSVAAFAGDADTTTSAFNASRFNIEKRAFVRVDSGTPDLRRVEFGVRYMPTFSSLDFNTYNNGVVKGEVTMSHGFGIMTAVNLTKHVGLQAEVNYYQITQKYKDGNFDNDLTINYLNIPVLLSLNTNKAGMVNLNLVAGPQFGLNVGSNFESSGGNGSDTVRAAVALRKGDVGVAYGGGLEFALNRDHTVRFDIGYRGFYGLVNMDATSNDQGTYNVVVSASRKTYGGYAGLTFMF